MICCITQLFIVLMICHVTQCLLVFRLLPPKIVREWKTLFLNAAPLYDNPVCISLLHFYIDDLIFHDFSWE